MDNWIKIPLVFLFLIALVFYTGRLLENQGTGHLYLTAALSPDSQTFYTKLEAPLSLTYIAKHLKGVKTPLQNFLARLKALAPDRIDYRIVDPDSEPGRAYAIEKKAAPFHVRDIQRDEHGEQTVWSSLVIAYGDHPEILIPRITSSDLPYLEHLLLAHLKAPTHLPRPVIAISAPQQFGLFTKFLGQWGDIALADSNTIPPDADVIFWLDPTSANFSVLQNAIDKGRTVVLAGSPYFIDYSVNDTGEVTYRAYFNATWEKILAPLGIRPQSDLLMDQSQGPILFRDKKNKIHQINAPFHLRVMPGFYDLKGFLSPARGALNFVSAGALTVDSRAVSEAGYHPDILGTTTDNAYIQPLPTGPFTNNHLKEAPTIGKQNVMLRLRHKDPWKGEILVLATSSPFRDGIFNQPNYAHRVFLQTIMRTFTDHDRILRGRVKRPSSPPIPQLSATSRVIWRVCVVFVVPLILLILGVCLYYSHMRVSFGHLSLRTCIAIVVLIIASPLWSYQWGQLLDLTAEKIHTPLSFSREQIQNQIPKADLIIPTRAHLPPALKKVEMETVARLNSLGINYTLRRPKDLSTAYLNRIGLRPYQVKTVRDDVEISQSVISGLLLHYPGNATIIPRLDDRTTDHLEFLLTTATLRLSTGKTPHIALISESPRLSPAEAHEYRQKHLSPPRGADVFSELKTLLRTYGYRVSYVNPRTPHLPPQTDLVIWMQPRRDASPMIALLSQHLARGGRAIVALQHYNIQQRQYSGGNFETVYWPQPQYQDLNRYLEPLGIPQAREVLMDQTRSRLALETQIYRRAVREYDPQEVALPFLIRAVPPHFDTTLPITRQLGDQLFIWGNRFVPDPHRLQMYNLTVTPLISTSNRTWAYHWSGGWLPKTAFSPDSLLLSHQSLALLVTGTFPLAEFNASSPTFTHPMPNPQGHLLLIGSSEMFKNEYLYAPGFQHEQFLLNAVAYLTHGPQFADLQARRKIAPGFSYLSPDQKILWRVLVVGLGPLSFGLYVFFRYIKKRPW
ncbi:MAG: hypothetical protein F4X51_20515 [Gemmatimonadetes bacterium]|nr:hypothetical protein [Gemmatimonadota bacterium]